MVKAKRGSILDRYGNPIAEDATSYSLYVVLSKKYTGQNNEKLYAEKKDFDDIAEILAKYTKLDKKTALKYLNNGIHEDGSTQYQVEFGTGGQNITLETRQKIEADLKKKKFQVFISMNIQPDYIPMVSLLLTLLAIQKQPIQMMIKKA